MHSIAFTLQSRNSKVGHIPVSTTSRDSCPASCALYEACYAKTWPLAIMWSRLSETAPGGTYKNGRTGSSRALSWRDLCASVAALPDGQLWRHNQAGDLPGSADAIDEDALAELADANAGKREWTYTHKPVSDAESPYAHRNRIAIATANTHGFTVNLSADNLAEADTLADLQIAPVVTILPSTVTGPARITTPAGRRVVVCPATYRDDLACADCALCQRVNRSTIVGFPAHGASKRKASAIASNVQNGA